MPTYHKIALIMAGVLVVITVSISGLLLFLSNQTDGVVLDYNDIQFSDDKKSAEVSIKVKTDEIKSLTEKGVYLVIPPINANWYQVTINDKVVGEVGNENLKVYIENYTGIFRINSGLGHCSSHSEKEIKILLKSKGEVQLNTNDKPMIYSATKINQLLFLERALRKAIVYIAMGIMMAGFCMSLLLYYVENKSRIFLIYSMVSLVAPISLLTGLEFNYIPISTLWFDKLTCLAFYIAIINLITFAKLLDKKAKKMYKGLYIMVVVLMVITIGVPTVQVYNKFTPFRDIINLLIINLCGYIIIRETLLKNKGKEKIVEFVLMVPIGVLSLIAACCEREIFSSFAYLFMELYFFKTIGDEIIDNKQHIDELQLTSLMIKMKAERDNLTGLYNQEAILKRVDEASINSSIGIIDIDKLKQINDEFGHNVGTKAIALIGEAFIHFFPNDKIGRYGGDEFVLVSKTSPSRLVNQLKNTNSWIRRQGKLIHPELELTISGGIATKGDGMTAEEVIEEADQLLYEAKSSGRNCVMRKVTSD